jgi:alpha-galactosidase
MIFPFGSEPDGKSWCGFQSSQDKSGYILIFREDNELSSAALETRLEPGRTIVFTPVLGDGKPFETKVNTKGEVTFSLPSPNSFALLKYRYK